MSAHVGHDINFVSEQTAGIAVFISDIWQFVFKAKYHYSNYSLLKLCVPYLLINSLIIMLLFIYVVCAILKY